MKRQRPGPAKLPVFAAIARLFVARPLPAAAQRPFQPGRMSNTEAMQRALTDVVSRGDFVVPPYPAVALRLQRLLAREGYGVAEVAEVLAADAALATTVLAAANSADQNERTLGKPSARGACTWTGIQTKRPRPSCRRCSAKQTANSASAPPSSRASRARSRELRVTALELGGSRRS